MQASLPPSPVAGSPGLVYFTEPTEGAFTLTVPPGWLVQAGVVRGALGPRPWYRALSPGGNAELRGSDPRVPTVFTVPWGPLMMPTPGMVLRPYTHAVAFADEYARRFASERNAVTVTVTGARDFEAMMHDDPRPEARDRARTLVQMGAEFGGVSFTGTADGRALRGIVDVVNLRTPGPLGLTWSPIITALVGPAEQWPHVRATLHQIAHSYVTSDAWQHAQSRMQQAQHAAVMESIETGNAILRMQAQSGMEAIGAHAQRAHIAAQTGAEIEAMRAHTAAAQREISDEMHRRNVNAVRETVDVYDPRSGDVFHGAPAGYTTWWTDGGDHLVGSKLHENPDAARYTQAVDLDDVPRKDRP